MYRRSIYLSIHPSIYLPAFFPSIYMCNCRFSSTFRSIYLYLPTLRKCHAFVKIHTHTHTYGGPKVEINPPNPEQKTWRIPQVGSSANPRPAVGPPPGTHALAANTAASRPVCGELGSPGVVQVCFAVLIGWGPQNGWKWKPGGPTHSSEITLQMDI